MRDTIRFVHKGQIRELENIDPTQTVLNFLRYEAALTGTKEGCAEGDCGACTIVLGELDAEGQIRYQAVNACIQFMPMLDGKQLLTIEDLKHRDGVLHPVQQAMVNQSATQCGFCTPGFVMSLVAERLGRNSSVTVDINNVLAGNLCRCTGYGSILEAAREAADDETVDHITKELDQSVQLLKELQKDGSLTLNWKGRRFFAPKSCEELAELIATYPQATLLAGATDVGLWVTKQHRNLETVILVTRIDELKTIDMHKDGLTIGSAVTYSAAWEKLAEIYDDLGELVRRIASTQIRNSGTIGGNIANGSPIGDMPPALIALNATLNLQGKSGIRQIPLEDFFIEYGKQDLQEGEFVRSVSLPPANEKSLFRNYKISKRFDQDISALCGAFSLVIQYIVVEDIRICFGGMAGTPARAFNTENALKGKSWSMENIVTAMAAMDKDYTPLTDMRASSEYRLQTAQNLLKKFFIETTSPEVDTRVLEERNAQYA
ncbi:MAG: xanthine dehydrogenase small subunit [Sneathiellales bacterium]|nr:xanthine dehydrogenase small subunit [Sneathiellales bacterium]